MKTQSLPKAKQTKGLRALIRVTANNSFHKLFIFFTNLRPEAQKPKTFRVATFYAQKLSG